MNEHDNNIKKINAIINYFKLLGQTEEIDNGISFYHNFILMGGMDSLRKLVLDSMEGNINTFSNTISDLYNELRVSSSYLYPEDLKETLDSISLLYKKYSGELGSAIQVLLPRLPVDKSNVSDEIIRLLDSQFLSKPREK